ncbi:MAG: hypothetical protein FLDDKLPJ_03512 [Phycisphaerae bacterium]|nr:hypothetical protein [Phycisphaerae bacterium]
MNRDSIEPILKAIPAVRQGDSRHYGVHPYFTRRPANVVRAYLERYSQRGDTVVDPFGGSGVTAIEAFLLGRLAIQNDLNPFANFIATCVVDTTLRSTAPLMEAFGRIEYSCRAQLDELDVNPDGAERLLERLTLPENIRLPRTSDAENFYDLFTRRQLAGLALLKNTIDREADGVVRSLLLLAWSASVAKLNKTFLSAKGRAESRGGSSIFSIYRYKLAKECIELPIWSTFQGRFENVRAAKEEVLRLKKYREQQSRGVLTLDSTQGFRATSHDAATLDQILGRESVDYIFTDPPYGGFISYLDLSVLWNHWLGFEVPEDAKRNETIVGGEKKLTEDHYKTSLRRSMEACLRLLKPGRWLSVVFQHWDVSYFSTILETVGEHGGELRAAITQTGDVIWSMHKKRNSESVISGEMILTFYKARSSERRTTIVTPPANGNARSALADAFDACLSRGPAVFTSEQLLNAVVIELWRRQSLSTLSLDRREFQAELAARGWVYDGKSHLWSKPISRGQPKEPMLFNP